MANDLRVLVVEDDQFTREMYVTILEKSSFSVTATAHGAAGLSEAQKGGFDVILLDLMMPQMDGLTFLKKLKEFPPTKINGPIIVLSNLAYGEAKEEALKLGAIDFLVKADMEPKEVVAAVTEATASSGNKGKLEDDKEATDKDEGEDII